MKRTLCGLCDGLNGEVPRGQVWRREKGDGIDRYENR